LVNERDRREETKTEENRKGRKEGVKSGEISSGVRIEKRKQRMEWSRKIGSEHKDRYRKGEGT